MQITCTTENLKKGLTTVSHIVGKNQNLPILNNVLLTVEDGIITLATTNLELGIKTQVRGKVEKTGSVSVPARLFTDYINNLAAEAVTMKSEGVNLKITAEKSHTTIKGVDVSEFPLLPNVEARQSFEVGIGEFKKALQQTVLASSNDTTRPELCNVLLKTRDKKLILAATDSYRLAEKQLKTTITADLQLLIPQHTLQEVQRVFDEQGDKELVVHVNDNQVKFSTATTFLISRIAEGQFPDYEQIIPTQNKIAAIVSVDQLARAIKAASIFCRQGINDVRLQFGNRGVTISALNDQVGESEVLVEAETAGDAVSIIFNYHYLLDVLGVVSSSEITFEVNDPMQPGVVRPKDTEDYVYVIMPIQQ